MIKEMIRSLLRTRMLSRWNRGCNCENVAGPIAVNPRNTVILLPNPPDHRVLLLGDTKHVDEFIGDLSGHTIQSRYNRLQGR